MTTIVAGICGEATAKELVSMGYTAVALEEEPYKYRCFKVC